MNDDVIIREATAKDIPKIMELYKQELNLFINRDVWEWEYFKRTGYETLYVVAEKDGNIIGSQALIPIIMVGNKRIFLSAKSESTLICKQYRGLGIFEKMYLKLFEIAELRGIKVIWGFTAAKKAFSKVGFNVPISLHLGQIPLDINKNFKFFMGKLKVYYSHISYFASLPLMIYLFVKHLRLSICRIYYDMKYHSCSKYVRELSKTDAEFDELLSIMNENNQKNGIVTIYRDSDYIKWRIINNPRIDYKILSYSRDEAKGYIIIYIHKDVLVITDYGCTNVDKVFPLLLNRVLSYGIKKECWCIQFWDKESPENRKYRKYFKHCSSIVFKNLSPMVIKTIGEGILDEEKNIGKWFITEIFSQGI